MENRTQVSVSVTNGGLWQGGLRNNNSSSGHQQPPQEEEEEEEVEVVEADASVVVRPSPRRRGLGAGMTSALRAWLHGLLMVAAAATDNMRSHKRCRRCVLFGSSRRKPMRISNTI